MPSVYIFTSSASNNSFSYNSLVPLSRELARRRYRQQAGWTQSLRSHIFTRAGLPNARRVLEVGCGTGAVLESLNSPDECQLHGLDFDISALQIARTAQPRARLAAGDAHRLPYPRGFFDIAYFHFVLMWLSDPVAALKEATRITRRGGAVIAFAEPDYSQRVDQPASLAPLGRLQTEALHSQGADPLIGSHLPQLIQAAGLSPAESGQLSIAPIQESDPLEWEVLRSDLQGKLSDADWNIFAAEDQRARSAGERVLNIPVFYAWARVE